MTEAPAVHPPGRLAQAAAMRHDPLVRNAFFLMVTTVLGAAAGFLFWVVVARLYPTAEVGRASSLLSTVALLSYFSMLEFSSAVIRFLPTSRRRAEDAGTALSVVSLSSIVVSSVFAVVAPWLAHDLGFLRATPLHAVLFVVLAGGAAVNLLTDSIFVACRAARANLLINGVLMSAVKLALPVFAVGYGAFGIFVASGLASTVAAVVSIVAIRRHLRIPVRPRISWPALRGMLRYSFGNYLSATLNFLPQIALPIIVLHQLGPVTAAVYFIAFQIANLVNSAAYAIGESSFAEGSHESRSLRALALRSAGLMAAVTGVAAAAVAGLAEPILRLFGDDYAAAGVGTLVIFTVSSVAVAFNTWTTFLLKVTGRLGALVLSNVVFAVVILGLALLKVPDGVGWAAVAWGVGNLVSGVVAAAAVPRQPAREVRA